jgi:hypothetical protein
MYYQYSPERLSTCPVTIHALLHIADYIKAVGPVWVSWAFPMERFCGLLQPSIKSRRFPYSSIDKYVVNAARLSQCKIIYNIADELCLTRPRGAGVQGQFSSDECMSYHIPNCNLILMMYHIYLPDPSCVLLPPRRTSPPSTGVLNQIIAALATRYDTTVAAIRKHIAVDQIEE